MENETELADLRRQLAEAQAELQRVMAEREKAESTPRCINYHCGYICELPRGHATKHRATTEYGDKVHWGYPRKAATNQPDLAPSKPHAVPAQDAPQEKPSGDAAEVCFVYYCPKCAREVVWNDEGCPYCGWVCETRPPLAVVIKIKDVPPAGDWVRGGISLAPAGYVQVPLGEVYVHPDGGVVVLGKPAEGGDHSCDAMGCSSVGLHVLYRFAAPQNLTAAPPVAPTPADLVYKQYRRSQMADVAADYFAVNFVSIPPASPPTLKLLPVVEEKPFQIVDDSPEDAPASTPKENDIDPEMQAMRLLGKHHKWQLDQTEPDQYGIVLADSYADSELGEQTTELLAKSYALDPPLWVVRMLLRRISCNHIHHHGFGPIFDAAMKLVGKGGPASPPTPSTRDAVDELLDAAEGVLVSADPGAMARLRDAVNAMAPRTVVGNAAGDAEQSPAVQRAMANFQRVRRDGLTPEQLAELDETGKAIEEAFEGYEAEVTEDARRKAWGLPPVAAGDAERRVVETAKAWKAAQERGDAIDIVEADSALIEAVDALAQSSAPTQSEEPQ